MRICYADINEILPLRFKQLKNLLLWEERKSKSERLRFEDDKKRCIGAGSLLMKMLRDEEVTDFEISVNEFGKPYLKNRPNLHFNISHSGDYVFCITDDMPVGIDVEKLSSANIAVAKRYFAKSEYEWIMEKDPEERFVRIWTLKESYAKYKGQGLGLSFGGFEAIPDLGKVPPDAFFTEYELPGYHISACASKKITGIIEKVSL